MGNTKRTTNSRHNLEERIKAVLDKKKPPPTLDQRGTLRQARLRQINPKPKVDNRKVTMGGVLRKSPGLRVARDPILTKKPSGRPPTVQEITNRRKMEKINTGRTCIINQSKGLGDIIFCEPIARMYHEDGYKVVWPVESQFCNINKHFPYITFVDKKLVTINYDHADFTNSDTTLIVPLRLAELIMQVPYNRNMASKYMLYDLPVETWRTTSWSRDTQAEEELFYEILQLSLNEPYNLVSEKYTSDGSMSFGIAPNNGRRNVFVEPISNYTLIDWSMVIENASAIYTVGSAINYIIEKLEPKTQEYHLFPRKPIEKDCQNYDYLFQKPYTMHV